MFLLKLIIFQVLSRANKYPCKKPAKDRRKNPKRESHQGLLEKESGKLFIADAS